MTKDRCINESYTVTDQLTYYNKNKTYNNKPHNMFIIISFIFIICLFKTYNNPHIVSKTSGLFIFIVQEFTV